MTVAKNQPKALGNEKPTTMIISGNHAAAYAAKMARVEVVAAYPITPSTPCVEKISEFVDGGTMGAKYIKVESEHSAAGALVGAASTGARTYSATSSHGLLYMAELIWWAALARLPAVLTIVNRELAPAWSIWAQTQDSMGLRDSGCIQYYCKNNQEVYDSVLMAYKISEHEQIYMPALVCQDAFILSHTNAPVEMPAQQAVDDFLPSYEPKHFKLDPENPVTHGNLSYPEHFRAKRMNIMESTHRAKQIIKDVCADFKKRFGRFHGDLIETYQIDNNTKHVIVSHSSLAEEIEVTVDLLREKGHDVGLIRLRVLRPFPDEDIREACKSAETIHFIERAPSYGYKGVIAIDTMAALYEGKNHPKPFHHIEGISGMDVTAEHAVDLIEQDLESLK
ncbi:MAG: pyruvate ferredoxin oxidoreductase [Candidatus Heimdallarchaeota archaeon]|nr:pyruvate ferredoxin oxidoreductase [Candidatus Heimdallarchaeota archaeon]